MSHVEGLNKAFAIVNTAVLLANSHTLLNLSRHVLCRYLVVTLKAELIAGIMIFATYWVHNEGLDLTFGVGLAAVFFTRALSEGSCSEAD